LLYLSILPNSVAANPTSDLFTNSNENKHSKSTDLCHGKSNVYPESRSKFKNSTENYSSKDTSVIKFHENLIGFPETQSKLWKNALSYNAEEYRNSKNSQIWIRRRMTSKI